MSYSTKKTILLISIGILLAVFSIQIHTIKKQYRAIQFQEFEINQLKTNKSLQFTETLLSECLSDLATAKNTSDMVQDAERRCLDSLNDCENRNLLR